MEDPLGSTSAEFEGRMIEGADGWLLNVFSWTPKEQDSANKRPIIVIPCLLYTSPSPRDRG